MILLGMTSGCLAFRMKQEIKFDEPALVSVAFESAEAAKVFHSKIKAAKIKDDNPAVAHSRFGIPFIILFDSATIYANAVYNSLADQADIDENGTITLDEAKNMK